MFWLGLLMAGMLVLMLLMSLLAARGYDRRRQADPAAAADAAPGPEPSEPEV